jgi:hypothetical protein
MEPDETVDEPACRSFRRSSTIFIETARLYNENLEIGLELERFV